MSKKFTPIPVHSTQALESSVAETVRLKLAVTQLQAEMQQTIAATQALFADRILPPSREIESREAGIYVYCADNRPTLFPAGKKSLDTLVATIGFRTTPPRVEKTSSKDKWATIAQRLLTLDWGNLFVRDPEPEVDKDAILAARSRLTPKQLAAAGITITSDEHFFIDPHADLAPASVASIPPAP